MAKLTNLDRARALGHLQAGKPHHRVANMFGGDILGNDSVIDVSSMWLPLVVVASWFGEDGKTRIIIMDSNWIMDGNLNAVRYQQEIIDPIAILYVRPNGILQDDNARPYRARFVTDHLNQ